MMYCEYPAYQALNPGTSSQTDDCSLLSLAFCWGIWNTFERYKDYA